MGVTRTHDTRSWASIPFGSGIAATLVAAMMCDPASATTAGDTYVLLTMRSDGKAVVSRNLTATECEFARRRTLGMPATTAEIARADAAEAENRRQADAYQSTHNCRTMTRIGGLDAFSDDGNGYCQGPLDGSEFRRTPFGGTDVVSSECLREDDDAKAGAGRGMVPMEGK